ncbi:hypothetical protein [Quadrisphaera sp. DSM 44207]|uniref:hypothetical protein n=1 Tax=Quadrisphaera sp. DSM 44207 TaxID=1881057 RepID=UPI00087E115A|nr:hypothetical protein [Quadrisphaera sp. DSM 44207]SDQ68373.1 hypothetical protein SAMN05428996_2375 [Quadrisphaera sp. DSM 44207]
MASATAGEGPALVRWLCAGCVAAVLTALALLGVAGRYPGEGPVLFDVSHDHGVHAGDLVVAAAWLGSVVLLGLLARRPRVPATRG